MIKTFIFCLFIVLFLIGCEKEMSDDEKARKLGLICINGYVFQKEYRGTTLEPLNIACENAKVIVD